MEIGTQIKALRLRKGVTQEAIAQAQEICGNDAEAIAALNRRLKSPQETGPSPRGNSWIRSAERSPDRNGRGSKTQKQGFEQIQSVCHAQHLRQPTGIHRQAAAKSISF